MNLFQKRYIILNSGKLSDFKIECDALTDKDWECIAYIVSKKFKFCKVFGVPTGGLKLAEYLKQYQNKKSNNILIVDDVLTTGNSMDNKKNNIVKLKRDRFIGVVLFARGKCPTWINPIFQMNF